MSQNTFHQFIKFSTDAYGLERTLRFLQSLTQLLLSYPSLPLALLPFLGFPAEKIPRTLSPRKKLTLTELKSRLSLGRRYFRLFRFLESFSQAFDKYIEASAKSKAEGKPPSSGAAKAKAGLAVGLLLGGVGIEKWLEILSKSFNGVYYCAETATFVDELKVDGLGVWGRELARKVMKEGNRMWFFALILAVLAGGWKVGRLGAEIAQTRREVRHLEKEVRRERVAAGPTLVKPPPPQTSSRSKGGHGGWEEQQQQWREQETRLGRVRVGEEKLEELRTKLDKLLDTRYKAGRRAVADVLDMAVPGKAVGWVPFSTGVVSALMLASTWLTGLEVWEKCGESVAKSEAKGEAKAKPKSE
ncbi:Putative PEX11B peroxisomal biogenesis factor 11 isoform B [Podospora comata]|uniref:PEX11B peroxisomal biogenesis factor 11 isoform B n=1 Tax=Podospora comata TaxID=48703 RepID=A0ABY6S9Y5_PODCO|nr:Putative PEX11B peroxisomal biogenesis factor 11 isoform B [Podospora comata]